MSGDERDVVERKRSDFPMLFLIAAITVALAAIGIGVGLTRGGGAASSPVHSPPAPEGESIRGTGPFVVFGRPGSSVPDQWAIVAADLSTSGQRGSRSINAQATDVGLVRGSLAEPAAQASAGTVVPVLVRVTIKDSTTTSGWLVRRDRAFGRPPIVAPGSVNVVSLSPDGARIGGFLQTNVAGETVARWCTWAVAGSVETCGSALSEGPTSPEDAPIPIAWQKSADEVLEYPMCSCDYWAPDALYVVGVKAPPRKLAWLNAERSFTYAASADGSSIAYADARNRRCTGDGPASSCANGPLLLSMTNVTTRVTRTLAEATETQFDEPRLSSGAHHVAYATGRAGEVAIVDALGRAEETLVYPAYDVHPLAFIGDDTLLIEATNPDPDDTSHGETRILAFHLQDGAWGSPLLVATGRDLRYLGWLR